MKSHDSSRRQFVKKAAYVAPAILSLQATSAFAKVGSGNEESRRERLPTISRPKPRKRKRRN